MTVRMACLQTSEGGILVRPRFAFLPQSVPGPVLSTSRSEEAAEYAAEVKSYADAVAGDHPNSGTEMQATPALPSKKMPMLCRACCGAPRPIDPLVLIAPDSFKGTMGAEEVAEIIQAAVQDCNLMRTIARPMSDGGEGFENAFKSAFGDMYSVVEVEGVVDPYGVPVNLIVDSNNTIGVIESAKFCPFVEGHCDALHTSSYSVGLAIRKLLDMNVSTIYLGVGGTANMDGGAGMMQALGAELLDANGTRILPGDSNPITAVTSVNLNNVDARLSSTHLIAACDVTTSVLQAVNLFGPQKGIKPDVLEQFNSLMGRFGNLVAIAVGDPSIVRRSGGGAGGGIGFAAIALCNAEVHSGFELICDATGLSDQIKSADLIITGEGKFDSSSFEGKVVSKIGLLAKKHSKATVMAFVGQSVGGLREAKSIGVSHIIEFNPTMQPDSDTRLREAVIDAIEKLYLKS